MGRSLLFLPVVLSWLGQLVPVLMPPMPQPLREMVGLSQASRTQSVPPAGSLPSAGFAPGSLCDSTSGNLGSSPIRKDILVLPLVVLCQPFVAVLPGPQPVQDCCLLATGPLPSSLLDNLHRHHPLRRHHLGLGLHHNLRRFAWRS